MSYACECEEGSVDCPHCYNPVFRIDCVQYHDMKAVLDAAVAEREAFDVWDAAGEPFGDLRRAFADAQTARAKAVLVYLGRES